MNFLHKILYLYLIELSALADLVQHCIYAMAGKVLKMNIIAINKLFGKLKVWCFKIPHYA